MYDFIIIGGGISGLNIAKKLNRYKILMIEKNDYLGGRIKTVKINGKYIEAGGSRFNNNHKRLIKLLKEFDIYKDRVKIPNKKMYLNLKLEDCPKNIIKFIVEDLSTLSKNDLINNTIMKLCKKKYKKSMVDCFSDSFFYYSEIYTCNAYDALRTIKNDLNEDKQYYIINGGMSKLIDSLEEKILNYTTILKKTVVSNVEYTNNQFLIYTLGKENKIYESKNLIVASGKNSMSQISFFKKISKHLNSIKLIPLVRIYAVYPKNGNKVWFHDLPKIITQPPIKFIIPVDYDKGIIMISYVDGKYAEYWQKHYLEGDLDNEINKEVKKLFPDRNIPKATKIYPYFWNEGISVWKPKYRSEIIFENMIKPYKMPLFICGENFSINHGWIEGALDTSNKVYDKIFKMKKTQKAGNKPNKSKKWKKFTMNEVKKHNTLDDALTVINGKVLDITKWIPKHPGGRIIRDGIGIDSTKLFKFHNHSTGAKNKLDEFQIGIIN